MKKLSVSLLLFMGLCVTLSSLTGCNKNKHWEYRAYTVNGIDEGDFRSKTVFPDLEALNKLGDEGWELVTTYEKLETAHPNYGNEKYVTGLQANTRTGAVVFLFKRQRSGSRSDKDTLEKYDALGLDPIAIFNKKAGAEFIAKKAKEPGYKKTASGLVYKVL
ncbi:MAG: FKBP-type peptidyl-prolyl cis-trans isomerase N-terminal domain-containing protein, partial [Muribaculaceae bacterium]|nr:FKBP-type peptidyl-prolyl cis-trans isomerase N-terminal domain-containing protein [Muribaculaceae bacterium]